jgi:homoaconitase/3-isopropylmalate dehydratase large subunit
MYGTMGNGIGANRADTTANGMSTTVTYGETVSGIGANRADTTANGTSTTVTYGETVSGIGAKDITITTATGKTVTTTVTTKTAIKIKESLPDNVPSSDLTPREKLAGGRTGGFLGAVTYAGGAPSAGFWHNGRPNRARINVSQLSSTLASLSKSR